MGATAIFVVALALLPRLALPRTPFQHVTRLARVGTGTVCLSHQQFSTGEGGAPRRAATTTG